MWIRGFNNTGGDILNGTPVYGDPTSAGLLLVADADADVSSRVLGIATHDIEDQTFGYVTTYGLVRSLNTSGLSIGPVYLSTTGTLTDTKPAAPANIVRIGACGLVDGSNGLVFVDPQWFDDVNGIATITFADSAVIIDATTNVQITNPTNNLFIYKTNVGHDITLSGDTLYVVDAGVYNIGMSASFEGGSGGDYYFSMKENGNTIPDFAGQRKTSSSDVGSASMHVSYSFSAGDYLTLWVEDIGTSANITMKHCTIVIEQVR